MPVVPSLTAHIARDSLPTMTLNRPAISSPSPALFGAVLCSLFGWTAGPVCRAPASEVISAIPGQAKPPISPAIVVETIEAGTRGPAPTRHGCADGCRGATCPHGRCSHAGCRHGACGVPGCPAHCPVRPASFGFYGTQWRSWPGHEVVQAAHTEPAAPVMPPKSEVPSADEESPVPGFELPAPEAETTPETGPRAAPALEPAPPEPQPAPRATFEPAPLPVPDDRPQAEPPVAPKDDNLFDEAALRRRGQERLAMLRQAAVHQERLRHDALRQLAPRVARPSFATFSPAPAATPAVARLPVDSRRGPSAPPRPGQAPVPDRPLRQAVHSEPEPRELDDASGPSGQLNPLR